MEWSECSQSSAAGRSRGGEKRSKLRSNNSGWQTRAHTSRLYAGKKKKCPKATQSAMSPRNTSTVSPTSSPSIYQCPENSNAVKSAALPRSRDHGKHSNLSHYMPLLKIRRLRLFLSIIIYIWPLRLVVSLFCEALMKTCQT